MSWLVELDAKIPAYTWRGNREEVIFPEMPVKGGDEAVKGGIVYKKLMRG
jgi:hypothetical protein